MNVPNSNPLAVNTAFQSPRARARAEAKEIRAAARRVLDEHDSWHNRMTLILALTVVLVVAVGIYAVCGGLYSVGYLIFGEALWLDVAAYGLMAVLGVLIFAPLAAGLWRLACLMTRRACHMEGSAPATDGLFYPFTSARAYGRCLAVGGESLAWFLLAVALPVGGFVALEGLFDRLATRGLHASLCALLTAVAFLVCVAFGALMFVLSGKRMGYGYFVFTREDVSLKEINRDFKSLRRGFRKPFALRLSLSGWVALSVVAILIPFVVHTIPYGLCCSAVYAAGLEKN